jgi:hypothetical protein
MLRNYYDDKYICEECANQNPFLCSNEATKNEILHCSHPNTGRIFKILTISDYLNEPDKNWRSCCKCVILSQSINGGSSCIKMTELINVTHFKAGKLCNFKDHKNFSFYCYKSASYCLDEKVVNDNGKTISTRHGRCKPHLDLCTNKGSYKNTKKGKNFSTSSCSASASTTTPRLSLTSGDSDSENSAGSSSSSTTFAAQRTLDSAKSKYLCKFSGGCPFERNYGFCTINKQTKMFCCKHAEPGMVSIPALKSCEKKRKKQSVHDRVPTALVSAFRGNKKNASFQTQRTVADGNCCLHSILFAYLSFHFNGHDIDINSFIRPMRAYCCSIWKNNIAAAISVMGFQCPIPIKDHELIGLPFLKLFAITLQFNILCIVSLTGESTSQSPYRSFLTCDNNPFLILQWDDQRSHVEILFHDVRNSKSHLLIQNPDIGADMSLSPFKVYHFTKTQLLQYEVSRFFGDLIQENSGNTAQSLVGNHADFMNAVAETNKFVINKNSLIADKEISASVSKKKNKSNFELSGASAVSSIADIETVVSGTADSEIAVKKKKKKPNSDLSGETVVSSTADSETSALISDTNAFILTLVGRVLMPKLLDRFTNARKQASLTSQVKILVGAYIDTATLDDVRNISRNVEIIIELFGFESINGFKTLGEITEGNVKATHESEALFLSSYVRFFLKQLADKSFTESQYFNCLLESLNTDN